jgi:effector-binding domain-containing protein
MSVGTPPDVYAAIAFTGDVKPSAPVRIIELPAATVAVRTYKGGYAGLRNAVTDAVGELKARGVTVDLTKTLRLLYPNSPDNTAPADLVTDIEIPVAGQGK